MEGYKTEESIEWERGGDLAPRSYCRRRLRTHELKGGDCVTAPSRASLNVEYRVCLIFFLIRSDFQ